MNARGGWWVVGGVVALVFAVSWLTVDLRSGGGLVELQPGYSTYGSNPGGIRGFYLALEEAGLSPRRVQTDWQHLPQGLGVLVVPPPRVPPSAAEWDAMAAWVRAGGRLVFVPPPRPADSGPGPDPEWTTLETARGEGLLAGVGRIAVHRRAAGRQDVREFLDRPGLRGERAVLLQSAGREVLTRGVAGAGEVLVLQDPEILSNGGILREDDLRLALNLVAVEGAVGFDEYHLGHGAPQESLWTLAPRATRAGLVHLAAALALLVFALSRRVADPWPERAPLRQRSEYLDSMAGLLARAGATGLVLRLRRQGLEHALDRLLHLPPGASDADRVGGLEALAPGLGRELEELLGRARHLSASDRPAVEALLDLSRRERHLLEKARAIR